MVTKKRTFKQKEQSVQRPWSRTIPCTFFSYVPFLKNIKVSVARLVEEGGEGSNRKCGQVGNEGLILQGPVSHRGIHRRVLSRGGRRSDRF